MARNVEEMARLDKRISDVRQAIEQTRHRSGGVGGMREQERIIALLAVTQKALEARKQTLKEPDQQSDNAVPDG